VERCAGCAQSICSMFSDGWLTSVMRLRHASSNPSLAPLSPFLKPLLSCAMLSRKERAALLGVGSAAMIRFGEIEDRDDWERGNTSLAF